MNTITTCSLTVSVLSELVKEQVLTVVQIDGETATWARNIWMASECEHSLIGAVPPLKTITKSPSVHCVQDHDEPARPLFLDNPRALRACHLHRDSNVCSTHQWSRTRFAGWLCLDRNVPTLMARPQLKWSTTLHRRVIFPLLPFRSLPRSICFQNAGSSSLSISPIALVSRASRSR